MYYYEISALRWEPYHAHTPGVDDFSICKLKLEKAEQVLLIELEAPESQSQTSALCESWEREALATPAASW